MRRYRNELSSLSRAAPSPMPGEARRARRRDERVAGRPGHRRARLRGRRRRSALKKPAAAAREIPRGWGT